ncbi:MAG: four helix bundle protein [Saprospiraceae bacterium]
MRNFRNYQVWKASIEVSKNVYKLCESFPKSELFGIGSQMKRAAVSISSNIAEGCSRQTEKEFSRFLEISLGSSFELETQIEIGLQLQLISKEDYNNIINELTPIQKQLNSLRTKLKQT